MGTSLPNWIARTVDDVLGDFPVACAVHGVAEARETPLVSGLLEPFVVLERRIKGELERKAIGRVRRKATVYEPFRETRHQLEDLIATV